MAAIQIKESAATVDAQGNVTYSTRGEWMIDTADDLASIENVAPGTVAATADLTLMYRWSGSAWAQIGGDDNEN